MEGLIAEAGLVRQLCPTCHILPIASTGAAAAELFRGADFPAEFLNELTYTTLFRRNFDQLD
jgi:hypothetical protein